MLSQKNLIPVEYPGVILTQVQQWRRGFDDVAIILMNLMPKNASFVWGGVFLDILVEKNKNFRF